MAQVLTRQELNWYGTDAEAPTAVVEGTFSSCWLSLSTFQRVLTIVIMYWALTFLLAPPSSKWIQDPATGQIILVQPLPQDLPGPMQMMVYHGAHYLFGMYTIVGLMNLRAMIRQRYQIPVGATAMWTRLQQEQQQRQRSPVSSLLIHPILQSLLAPMRCCVRDSRDSSSLRWIAPTVTCEDLAISVGCACCSIAQMARHTADYTHHPASCCSSNGLVVHPMRAPPRTVMV
jgi:hypothetical protein